MSNLTSKRILDLVVSWGVWFLSAPLVFLLSLLIKWRMPGPVFFRQIRPGLHGKPFTICKLRTMTMERDKSGRLLPDAERLTPLGSFIRTISLDELPELVNVINGQMSLVGPRPLLFTYLEHYSHEQARRHEVKPGITGWAQVNGRNAISWADKFNFDLWYVDNRSFALDLHILLITLIKVLKCENISQEGHSTMPEFKSVKLL